MKMIPCPTCGEELEDTGALAGKLVRCPNCSTEFRMPGDPSRPRSPEPVYEPYASPQASGWSANRVPGKLQVVQVLLIVGGVTALIAAMGWASTIVGLLWPGAYYSLLVGTLALIRGVRLLNGDQPPKGTAVMQILNFVALDFINVGLGIAELVLLNDPEVQEWYERRRSF